MTDKPDPEVVCLPTRLTLDMSIAFAEVFFSGRRYVDDTNDEDQDWYEALLAARPATEYVPISRDLLRRIEAFIVSHAKPGPVDPIVLGEVRALLGEKGGGR